MAVLRWGAATDEGRVRPENEDHHFVGPSLFVVADGMGGHQAGEIASQLAVDRLVAGLDDGRLTIADLADAIGQANHDIFTASTSNAEQHGMGTTITSLAVMDDEHEGEMFALANVGDSRTYVLRHGRLRQLTIDHSYVQELVAEGHITRDEARDHPRRNIVTRALGIEPTIRVDSWTLPIVRGDRFLLCSDGLVDEVHDDDILPVLTDVDDPQAAAEELVRLALENGGRDNVTVVVVDVVEGQDPPDPTEELDAVPAWAAELGDDDPAPTDTAQDASPAGGVGRVEVDADPPVAGSGIDAPDLDPSPVDTDAPLVIDPDAVGDPPPAPVEMPATSDDDAAPSAPRRSRRRLFRFLALIGVAAVLIFSVAVVGAWARSGYFVTFDDNDEVAVYRGQTDRVLWFDPTLEFRTDITRDQLDEPLIGIVDAQRRFSSLRNAELFVEERLRPAADAADADTDETTAPARPTTTTTTTTTTTPATTTDTGAGDAGS